MTLLEQIDEIEKRAEAATPGPWKATSDPINDGEHPGEVLSLVHPYEEPGTKVITETAFFRSARGGYWNGFSEMTKGDFDFIAASRTDVPRLCKALRFLWGAYQASSDPFLNEEELTAILKGEEK